MASIKFRFAEKGDMIMQGKKIRMAHNGRNFSAQSLFLRREGKETGHNVEVGESDLIWCTV